MTNIHIPRHATSHDRISQPVYSPVHGADFTGSSETLSDTNSKNTERSKPWRPFTLKLPFLFFLLALTLGLLVLIEVMRLRSSKDGGIIFAWNSEDFTVLQVFAYRYFPTILAVVYGTIWGLVDLDAKRLEPFFQLSKPEGATLKGSLLLEYPTDLMAGVPITSWIRRHWGVFCTSTAVVLVSYVVIPLQSSLLAVESIERNLTESFVPYKTLLPVENQSYAMNAEFLSMAVGVAWLEDKLPPFTTSKDVTVPFKIEGQDSEFLLNGGNESWVSRTRVYSTDLKCRPGITEGWQWMDTQSNCSQTFTGLGAMNDVYTRRLIYMGSGRGLGSDYGLNNCTLPNTFLAMWMQGSNSTDLYPEALSVWCQTEYWYRDAEVTVDGTTGEIQSYNYIGDASPLTSEEFDIVQFEGIVSSSYVNTSSSPYPQTQATNQDGHIDEWRLKLPVTAMTGYALAFLGTPNGTFDDIPDVEALGRAFGYAHKLLFSMAFSDALLYTPDHMDAAPVVGNRLQRLQAVVVVPSLAYILEAFLAVVAVIISSFLVITTRRSNSLLSDPDSLGAKMTLVAESRKLLQDFDGLDDCPHPGECLDKGSRYRLGQWQGYFGLDREKPTNQVDASRAGDIHEIHSGEGVRPYELDTWVGVVLVLFQIAILGVLCFLYASNLNNNGLPTLTDNQVLFQVVFAFVPTIIATILKPIWVILTRLFCMYQPYTELGKSNATPSTLALKYTALPAALVFFRALRYRHFLLFSISMIAILGNVLAVAFGGLFESQTRTLIQPAQFPQQLSPTIATQIQIDLMDTYRSTVMNTFARSTEDHYAIANSNITKGTALPPWISPEYFFLPFGIDQAHATFSKANTRGFGGNLTCQPFQPGGLLKAEISELEGVINPSLNWNITLSPNGNRTVRCTSVGEGTINWNPTFSGIGKTAIEIISSFVPLEEAEIDGYAISVCRSALAFVWGRANVAMETGPRQYSVNYTMTEYRNTSMLCMPNLTTAMFEVTVDNTQRISEYKMIGELETDINPYIASNITSLNVTAQISTLMATFNSQHARTHNDTAAGVWPFYLMDALYYDRICDPATPPPDYEVVVERMDDFFKRLLAILAGTNYNRIFLQNTESATLTGETMSETRRVAMDKYMFFISIIILTLNIAVAIYIYVRRPEKILPRVPTNLAAEIGFFYASNALEDLRGTLGMSTVGRTRHLEALGHTYGYGSFIGRDGKKHRGVERQSILSDYRELTEDEN